MIKKVKKNEEYFFIKEKDLLPQPASSDKKLSVVKLNSSLKACFYLCQFPRCHTRMSLV